MAELIFALIVFTALHLIPSTPLRAQLIEALGRQGFAWAFSAASGLLLVWAWLAYRAVFPETVFWVTGPVVRWLSALVMLAAVVLAVLAIAQRPRVLLTAEVSLRSEGALKGVMRITRHPLLWPVATWGLVHMLNNADPPSWVFFGYVTALALGGTWLIDRRRAKLLGPRWPAIEARTSNLPLLAIADGRNALVWEELPLPLVALGVGVWLALLILHPILIGAPAVWL